MRCVPYLGTSPPVARLTREKLGENASAISSVCINSQIERLLASLRSSLSSGYGILANCGRCLYP